MMSEMKALVWSAVLTWLMLLTASLLRSKGWTAAGREVALGNRDHLPEPTALAGRADRAARNMLENLALFTAVVLAAQMSDKLSAQTQLGASIVFWARLAYGLIYLAGIRYARTAAWFVAVVGMGLIASTLF